MSDPSPAQDEDRIPEPGLRGAIDTLARQSQKPVSLWLSVLFAAFAASHLLVLEPPIALPMAATAAVTSLIFLAFRLSLVRWVLPLRFTSLASALIVGLALGNSFLHLLLTRDIHQTTNLMLVVVGAAYFLLSTPWFVALLVATVGGWAAAVIWLPPTPLNVHFGFGLSTAAVLAAVVFSVNLRRLQRLQSSMFHQLRHEQELDRIFTLSLDLLGIAGLDGRLERVNPAFERALGVPGSEMLELPFLQFVHPDDREATAREFEQLRGGRESVSFENRLLARDGSIHWVSWNAVPLPGGSLTYAAGRDITVRKRMEELLRLSYAAMEAAASGIMITDRQGTVTWINPAFTQLTGYSPPEAIGHNTRFLKAGKQDPAFYEELWSTVCAGLVWRGELINRRKDGSTYTEEQTVAPVRDTTGEISHFVSVKQDVTARREVERILSENAKRLQQELDLAQQVQASLLPDSLPSLEGYELAALALPARFVSGDLYDWHLVDSFTCSLVMADISGKGVPAAMLASAARVLLHSAQGERTGPADLLSRVASLLHEDLERAGMFITLFAVSLDASRGRLTYANAGHTEGLLMRGAGGACERLPATGMPIGISREASIGETSLALLPGDTLLLYSDGVTEASSPGGELFGVERLIGLLSRIAIESAETLVRDIGRTVADYCGGAALSDDLTVIAVKALPRLLAFAYPATLDRLGDATAFFRGASAIYGETFASELELVCSELITNIIQHAYRGREGEIRGLLSLLPEGVRVELWDDGAPFDPALLPPPDLGQLRDAGYGLYIVRRLTSKLAYVPATERGNLWTIEKNMEGEQV